MMMRYVDGVAIENDMEPGSMFFFAAFLQFFALYCSYKLPEDKSNSKPLNSLESLEDKSEEMLELK